MDVGIIWLVLLAVILCFGFVVLFGAPYLPTLTKQVEIALDLLDLQPGQTMLELGCGDGKVLIAATRRGWKVVGYELNPLLVLVAWIRTRRYRRQVKIVWGNFFTKDWPPAEGIFSFVLPRFMAKVDRKIISSGSSPVKLASFAFSIPHKKPLQQKAGVFLYHYE